MRRADQSQAASPVNPDELSLVLSALTLQPLTLTVANIEALLLGKRSDEIGAVLKGSGLGAETAVAAMAVRESLGRISDLVHASVICAALPRILQPGEQISVRPSLASGNDHSRHYDLETDRRIAEFKVAVWQGGANRMRQRTRFADMVTLALDERPLAKQLFVVGEAPARFLRTSRSDAHRMLQRSQQSLRDRFAATYGVDPRTIASFTNGPGPRSRSWTCTNSFLNFCARRSHKGTPLSGSLTSTPTRRRALDFAA